MVVVARVMVMLRCGCGVEDRRGVWTGRSVRRRTLVTGGCALAGGVLRVDVVPDDEVDGHLVRGAKLLMACQFGIPQRKAGGGRLGTFCSPKMSSRVSLSRFSSLPW